MPSESESRPLSSLRSSREWLRSEDSFRARIFLAGAAAVVAIVLLAGVFLFFQSREAGTAHSRVGSFEMLRLADRVENDLANIEGAYRDYLTKSGQDLVQYERRRSILHLRLAQLMAKVADSEQAELIAQVREKVVQWESRYAEPQMARKFDTGETIIPSEGEAVVLLDEIRRHLWNFSRHEADRWETIESRAEEERRWQMGGFGVLCVVAIGLIVICSRYGYYSTNRHIQKIASARAQFRQIVDHTLDGLLAVNRGGTVTLANPAAARLFGTTESGLVGHHLNDLFPHGGFGESLDYNYQGLFETEARQVSAPFGTCPVEISLSQMEADGKQELVVMVRDITERWRNEEALRQIGLGVSSTTGEAFVNGLVTRLSQSLDVSCAFIVEVVGEGDSSMHVITMAERGQICGSGSCDLSGTACAEVLGDGYRAYLSGVQQHFPSDWLVAAFGGESFVCVPLVDHMGRNVGLLGVIDQNEMERVDLVEATLQIFAARAAAEIERKHFAQSLAREKELLAVTLGSIGDACIAIDNTGQILLFNQVAERLTGWSAEIAVGASIQDILALLNPHTRRPLRKPLASLIETGSASEIAGVSLVVAQDGSERVIETNASPIEGQQGEKVGSVLVLRDVTERQRTMEERQKAEKLESLGIAAGGIAHDFNNLLTAILGNLSLVLMQMHDNEAHHERLASAKRASLRAQELAQQLLTFAKGGAPIKKAASIGQLVRDTVTFHLRGSQVRCDFSIPDNLWPVVIDAGQISQVVQNLTINADQAMPAGGMLSVTCANLELRHSGNRLGLTPGRYLKISVKDEGIGIPDEFVKKIFDPYFTTKPKGSGLGLATSYSIIKNHNGMIEVSSQPGQGTIFYIFLPAAEDGVIVEPEPEPEEMEQTKSSGRVLVLDDEDAICALVTCALEPMGFEVVETFDADTAIKEYTAALNQGRKFDIVISDLTIPGSMSGKEAVARMRQLDPTVRAIVSSGYAMDPIMSSYQEHGFCAMIAKPYEIATLGRVVAEVMNRPPVEKVIKHDFAA